MSKLDNIADIMNLEHDGIVDNLPSPITFPIEIKDSLKSNKDELLEVYQMSKELFTNLVQDAKHVARPRDIEVINDISNSLVYFLI